MTLAKPDAMTPAVKAALAKDIPVVAFNSGFDNYKAMGVQEYFGQDEKLAGHRGRRTVDPGRRQEGRLHHPGAGPGGTRIPLRRCQGGIQGANRDPERQQQGHAVGRVDHHRQTPAGPDRRPLVALGAPIALAAVQSKGNANSQATIVTFDTNAALVDAIQAGDVEWAVDQQPFLQGYLAIDSLWLFINNKNQIGGGQADADGSFVHRPVQHRLGRRAGQGRNSIGHRAERETDDYTDRPGRRGSQVGARRARQGTKSDSAPADPPGDGCGDRRGRHLHLLPGGGAAASGRPIRWRPCCTAARRSGSWRARSRC